MSERNTEYASMKRAVLAIRAVLALASAAALPTSALARGPHGGGLGGHLGGFGGHVGGFGGHFGGHFGGRGFGPGFGVGPFAYGYYGGCSTLERVWTPYGWRWRRVWAC
jgi:hypothetical protein